MTLMRILAVIAVIIGIILFIISASNGNVKDVDYGLAATAAAIGFLALDPLVGRVVGGPPA
jgi:hypothetical protein